MHGRSNGPRVRGDTRRWSRIGGAVGLAMLVGASLVSVPAGAAPLPRVASSVRFHPGASDLGDPLTPGYGNGGYDVRHYGITLRYSVHDHVLVGRTTITARLTENLSRFNLDFVLPTRSVTVNGQAARFRAEADPRFVYGRELVVTPSRGLRSGSTMTVVVTYRADPLQARIYHLSEWTHTITGVTVWDEPIAASEWWFPGNDYPSDKATYDVSITTSKADQVVTNGRLVSRRVHGPGATTRWRSRSPLSTHLTFLDIGRYDVVQRRVAGKPATFAYERTGSVYVARARRDVSQEPRIVRRLQRWFGPYPFPVAGAVVSQTQYGTAFESQTRPTFTALYWKNHVRNVWAVVHELVHQWYGDDAGMSRWRHIWLAEGFATYGEWLWSGAHGHGSTEQLFESDYGLYPKHNRFWSTPVVHPDEVLGPEAYERGAMTLQALRNRVGSPTFFSILRSWAHDHRFFALPSIAFERLAERTSGTDLSAFFRAWLESAHRPAPVPRNGFPPGFALPPPGAPVPPSFAAIHRTDTELAARAG